MTSDLLGCLRIIAACARFVASLGSGVRKRRPKRLIAIRWCGLSSQNPHPLMTTIPFATPKPSSGKADFQQSAATPTGERGRQRHAISSLRHAFAILGRVAGESAFGVVRDGALALDSGRVRSGGMRTARRPARAPPSQPHRWTLPRLGTAGSSGCRAQKRIPPCVGSSDAEG